MILLLTTGCTTALVFTRKDAASAAPGASARSAAVERHI
jgi:hypothetical protein